MAMLPLAAVSFYTFEPAPYIMERAMLLGIRDRAERMAARRSGRSASRVRTLPLLPDFEADVEGEHPVLHRGIGVEIGEPVLVPCAEGGVDGA